MTQHMQDRVSRAASAEQRQELSHSQVEGRARGVAQAAHLHLPHLTQMIDWSAAAGGALPGLLGWGGIVITGELGGRGDTD